MPRRPRTISAQWDPKRPLNTGLRFTLPASVSFLGLAWPLPVHAQITLNTTLIGNVPDVVSASGNLQTEIQNFAEGTAIENNIITALTNYNEAVAIAAGPMTDGEIVLLGAATPVTANIRTFDRVAFSM